MFMNENKIFSDFNSSPKNLAKGKVMHTQGYIYNLGQNRYIGNNKLFPTINLTLTHKPNKLVERQHPPPTYL